MDRTCSDVTVVVPNWNGRADLARCLESLDALEGRGSVGVIVVDNGSDDGSREVVRSHPGVRWIGNEKNEGFARACNVGARAADTPLLAFLNNDARVEPDWMLRLLEAFDDDVACVAGRILSWDGTRVSYGGAGMCFHGIGFQVGIGRPAGEPDQARDVLFACGGAMLIDREVFLAAGGFDEDFFAYYEDVDFGWRLWALGERVRYEPRAVCYHRHSQTSGRLDVHRVRRLQVRNPLLTILKNYEDDTLLRALPAALLLTLRRTRYLMAIDESEFSLGGGVRPRRGPFARRRARIRAKRDRVAVPRVAVADVLAVSDVLDALPRITRQREWLRARRRRGDDEIAPLFLDPRWAAEETEEWPVLVDRVLAFFGLEDLFEASRGLLESARSRSVGRRGLDPEAR